VPKYNVNVSFSLRTMIEPEGIHFDRDIPEGVEDFSDESYFRNNEIDADGGAVSFTVEAESEEDAERISEEIVYDGQEWEDNAGFTWIVDDRSVEVEKVIVPMTQEFAVALVQKFIAEMEGMDDELREAFGFLLSTVVNQAQMISDHRAEITRLDSVVARQAGEIDRLTAERSPDIVVDTA